MPDRVAGKVVSTPRLVDVARAAGVSRGTASNVFAHPDRVRPELRARVETAAAALGYEGPNPTARYLRAGRANAIGVIVPEEFTISEALHNPFFRMFLIGVSEVCDEAGVNLTLLAGSGETVRDAIVDGFILTRAEYLGAIDVARQNGHVHGLDRGAAEAQPGRCGVGVVGDLEGDVEPAVALIEPYGARLKRAGVGGVQPHIGYAAVEGHRDVGGIAEPVAAFQRRCDCKLDILAGEGARQPLLVGAQYVHAELLAGLEVVVAA